MSYVYLFFFYIESYSCDIIVFFNRPINNSEKVGKSSCILELPSNKEVVVHEKLHDKFTRKFTFDKVFGPTSKQVYRDTEHFFTLQILKRYTLNVCTYIF